MNQSKKQKRHHPKLEKKTPEIEPGKREEMTEIEPGKIETRPEDLPEPPGDYPQEPYRDEEAGLDEGDAAEQQSGHA